MASVISAPLKPPGNSSAIKPVESAPDFQRAFSMMADTKGILCWIPLMTKLSRAVDMAAMASARVGAWVHSLAIIGSYQMEISPPSNTPVSLRTVTPFCLLSAGGRYFTRRPVEGRKLR